MMSRSTRYFKNIQPDFSGSQNFELNKSDLKNWILELSNEILKKCPPVEKNCDGGLYVGNAGIAYTFYYLSKSKLFSAIETAQFMKESVDYLKVSLDFARHRENVVSEKSSFILGNAGVYALAAVVNKKLQKEHETKRYIDLYIAAAANCKPKNFLRCGSDELFVGRAGYICGALWLQKELGTEVVPQNILNDLCQTIVKSGAEYARAHHHKAPLMYAYYNTEYLGAAHGLSSILLMLMSVTKFMLQYQTEADLVRQTVDFLLALQTPSGNFPCAMDEIHGERPPEEELVHWCHGAPGVFYTFVKAYLLWQDPKYLQACIKCADLIWEKGLLKKGPGICHGVAGNAYVFLILYRLTDDMKYYYRACEFAKFMKTDVFRRNARTPDSPYSLYEGIAGTVCFLADLDDPKQAAFPFMDVF